jgi:hypothetical protein
MKVNLWDAEISLSRLHHKPIQFLIEDRFEFEHIRSVHDFDGETVESRSSRRNANWMPATILR